MGEEKKNRYLEDESAKNDHNAWDNVKIEGENLQKALAKLEEDIKHVKEYNEISYNDWENFYKKYNTSFFKDRKWIKKDFKDLFSGNIETIFEIGCGVGNSLTFFHENKCALKGIDVSQTAVEHCQKRYPMGEFKVQNIASDEELNTRNVDGCLLIYTLSAIDPKEHGKVFYKASKILKKGGLLCFRDYGLMDMVQLRYKNESTISKNFYKRSDGTFTYFFTEEEIKLLAEKNGFEIKELKTITTLLVNRKRNLDMYRVYIHGIFKKK